MLRIRAEHIIHSQAPHEKNGAEDPIPFPTAAGRHDPFTQTERWAKPLENPAQGNIFHKINVGKTADRFEEVSFYEHGLITCGNPGQPRSPVHQAFHDAKKELGSRQPDIETSPTSIMLPQAIENQSVAVLRQEGVCMKKKKDLSGGRLGPCIHLTGTTTGTDDHSV
jgi:hypothetical protein